MNSDKMHTKLFCRQKCKILVSSLKIFTHTIVSIKRKRYPMVLDE